MKYLIALLLLLSACGGPKHNKSRGLTNQCSENPGSCYPAGTYVDPESIYQAYQASPYSESQDSYYPGKYVPIHEPETKQPYSFTNTQTGNTYTQFGDGWYIDSQGDTIRRFGQNSYYIDDRGKVYMPFGNGLIDPQGNTYMGQ